MSFYRITLPFMPQTKRKNYIFPIRLTQGQKSQIEDMARRVGKSPTDFVRDLVLIELGRHIGSAEKDSGQAA
jgi:hypothetical protein